MAMTRAQWEALQRRLPIEDRVSYEDYLASLGTNVAMDMSSRRYTAAAQAAGLTPAPVTTSTATQNATVDDDAYYRRDPKTGFSQAQLDAQKALAEAVSGANALGITTSTNVAKPGNIATVKYAISTTFEGTGKNRIKITKFNDGTESREAAPETVTSVTTSTPIVTPTPVIPIPSGLDPATLALIQSLQSQISNLTASNQQAKIDAAAQAEADKRQRAENAISILTSRFSQYNLQSLVPKIRELAIGGATEATITLQLQETEEYRQRFRANQDRIKKGLTVLDPGDYINLEDKYRQILRAYGLRQFDTDDYVTQFISNDVSTAELSSRVQLAVQRVQNADPSVLNTLTRYYGIGTTDLVAYALDPDTQFQKIERQVGAAEIGAAAGLQGIQPGVVVAEQLAAQGVTQAEARKGYATIADILPSATKLSEIYGNVLEGYGLAEAEQEVFNSLASAQRKRRALIGRETAAFSGASGLGRTSLGSQIGGQI
jgi:hypothetical protein